MAGEGPLFGAEPTFECLFKAADERRELAGQRRMTIVSGRPLCADNRCLHLNVWLEQALAFLYTAPCGSVDVAYVALDSKRKQATNVARQTGRYTVGTDSDMRHCADDRERRPVIAKNRPCGLEPKDLVHIEVSTSALN